MKQLRRSFSQSDISTLENEAGHSFSIAFIRTLPKVRCNSIFVCTAEKKRRVMTIRVIVILLSFSCCCHLQEQLSSYFTFSYLKQPREDSHGIRKFQVDTELACALRCSRKNNCDEAIFHRASKKCFLYRKDKCSKDPDVGENNKKPRILTMAKVRNEIHCRFPNFSS